MIERERAREVRGSRWAEERVLPEGLEGQAAKEPGDAGALGAGMLGAIVDDHLHHEDRHAGDEDDRHDPGPPSALGRRNASSLVVVGAAATRLGWAGARHPSGKPKAVGCSDFSWDLRREIRD